MRAFPWVMAGIGLGAGLTILLMNQSRKIAAESGTGYDGVERAARKTYGWGTKTRVGGKMAVVAGTVKEGVGRFTGDGQLASEGAVDRVVGNVKDTAGQVGHAVGETIHDLNR